MEIRHVPLIPTFKLYLINRTGALHGMYEVIERPIVPDDGEEIEALDVLGLGAALILHVKDDDPESPGTLYVESMQAWFESVWRHLCTP